MLFKGLFTLFNRFFRNFPPPRQLLDRWEVPLAGLLLAAGFTMAGSTLALAFDSNKSTVQQEHAQEFSSTLVAAVRSLASEPSMNPIENHLPNDGIYLYGRSPEPEQIGSEYLVFEVRDRKVIGAFYMPSSEFNCFYGTLGSQQMNLTVVDPFDKVGYPYSIALEQQRSPVAVAATQGSMKKHFGLQGYYPVAAISENDQQILSVCRNDHQEQVGN